MFDAERFYEEQIEYLVAGKTDELIDALKKHFRQYVARLGKLVVKSTDHFVEAGDAILLEARVATDLGEFAVYDAFVMRDGKIANHFTAVK